jgi:hypothetical protein
MIRNALILDGNTYAPKRHPTRPELQGLHHERSDTWLVEHDGGWTGYAQRSIWTDARCSSPEDAYRELVRVLRANDPFEEDDRSKYRRTVLSRLGLRP